METKMNALCVEQNAHTLWHKWLLVSRNWEWSAFLAPHYSQNPPSLAMCMYVRWLCVYARCQSMFECLSMGNRQGQHVGVCKNIIAVKWLWGSVCALAVLVTLLCDCVWRGFFFLSHFRCRLVCFVLFWALKMCVAIVLVSAAQLHSFEDSKSKQCSIE